MWVLILVTLAGPINSTALNLSDCREQLRIAQSRTEVLSAICRAGYGDEVDLLAEQRGDAIKK
jgi:hypothetical protein